jgi:predicted DsbA family dithiol-disulfide isomerase
MMLAMLARKMIVYGDLNCPFCYALEEWLIARQVQSHVEWRLVEHAPELPHEPAEAKATELEELVRELEDLSERAPDVVVGPPRFRPNSGFAIQAVAEALAIDARRAGTLRLLLFRALWREGRNIADPSVVAELVEHAGLPPLRGTTEATATALRWTLEWRDARFERIPVMISDVGTKLLGLVPPRRLELFLASGLFSESSELACDVDGQDE